MIVRSNGQPHQIYTRDRRRRTSATAAGGAAALPSGHPEAFFEAFANVYTAAYDDMVKRAGGQKFDGGEHASTPTSPTASTA